MKRTSLIFVVLTLGLTVLAGPAEPKKPGNRALTTETQKISYALGQDIGSHLKALNSGIDLEIFYKGVADAMKGNKPLLSEKEAIQVRQEFGQKLRKEREEKAKKAGAKNLAEGEAFLAKNKAKKGVTTLPSGLQYEVVKEGTGPSPKADDKVTVNYRGTLIDGTEFDSSYKRGKPATFPVSGVIKGWTEGLQHMKVGGTYMLYIPSKLAYGDRGAGRQIGPNAALIFKVELLSIEKKAEKPAADSKSPALQKAH